MYDRWDVRAVLFDLDDTLFEASDWIEAAKRAVAGAARTWKIDRAAMSDAIDDIEAQGTGAGRLIERALERAGVVGPPNAAQIAFWTSVVEELEPYAGVPEAIDALRDRFHIGLVTDGDQAVQWSKLRALGLERSFDVVVLTDALDPSLRRPRPEALLYAAWQLDVAPPECVHIGDSPGTDSAAAIAAGMRAIRVRTGPHAAEHDDPLPWLAADDIAGAIAGMLDRSERSNHG